MARGAEGRRACRIYHSQTESRSAEVMRGLIGTLLLIVALALLLVYTMVATLVRS
jgi:hypothetical protein